VDPVTMDGPKTRAFAGFLAALGVADRKVLVLTSGIKPALYLSARNIPTARVMPFHEASAYDVLWAGAVVVEAGALGGEEAEGAEATALDAAPARKVARKAAPKAKAKAKPKAAPKAKAKAKGKAKAKATAKPNAAPKAKAKPAARKKKED
jgi:Meckel syndrome type 1 protein